MQLTVRRQRGNAVIKQFPAATVHWARFQTFITVCCSSSRIVPLWYRSQYIVFALLPWANVASKLHAPCLSCAWLSNSLRENDVKSNLLLVDFDCPIIEVEPVIKTMLKVK